MSDGPHSPSRAPPPDKDGKDGSRLSIGDGRGESAGQSAGVDLRDSSASAASSKRETAHGTEDGLLTENDDPLPATSATARSSLAQGRDGASRQSARERWWNWIPFPLRRAGVAVATWVKGPPNAQPYKIAPFFPKVQQFPIWLLDQYLPKLWQRVLLVIVYLAMWATAFAMVIRMGQAVSAVGDLGEPASIGCGSSFWSMGNGCGIDGMYCRPFNGSGLAFRCPANCQSYRVLNPRAVGDQEVNYRPLVVGGPPDGGSSDNARYRGDSHICSSAIHSGVVSNTAGGCGVVYLTGQHSNFVASDRNGISSVGFDSNFPLSFTFLGELGCEAKDLRWPLLGLSVAFSSVFSLFVSSAPLFFFAVFTGIFWHVGMVSDPPSHSSIAGLASNILGKYLPAMLAAWIIFDKMGVRRTLTGLTAQMEKTILWLGACWLGALENYSFEVWIPITRLTGRDLDQQPGAKAALAFLIVALVVIVATQVYFFRQEGRLLRYLKVYLLFVTGIIICLLIPDLKLRIHHYILALLLLLGTSMQTRPSLLYQGLLVGLFINGVARWGFDSLLQTAASLQGDGQYFSDLPAIATPTTALAGAAANGTDGTTTSAAAAAAANNVSTITFTWEIPPIDSVMDGISVLVNDVERYRGYFRDDDSGASSGAGDASTNGKWFQWTRKAGVEINEYFRFGYMVGTSNLDYTRAGIWNARGEWVQMADGPSKVRRRAEDDVHEQGRAWLKKRR